MTHVYKKRLDLNNGIQLDDQLIVLDTIIAA